MLADLALSAVAATEVERMVGKGTEHLIASVLRHVLALATLSIAPGKWWSMCCFPALGPATNSMTPLSMDSSRAFIRGWSRAWTFGL